MAKTYRDLWPLFTSWDNLVLAYRKCRRRKRYKPDAVRFHFEWEANLIDLRRKLEDGTYRPGEYRHFYIHDPKKRKISAAPFVDRIVHHAVVNVLEPIWEPRFVFDTYACRKGKGTHRALDRAESYLRRYPYYLKTDIVKFFPSIDHEILLDALCKRLADARIVDLLQRIIASGARVFEGEVEPAHFPTDDLFSTLRSCGLPIGNLTSQFLANVYLDPIDHFIKDELGIAGYVRYCDDLLLFSESKQHLRGVLARLEQRLALLRLRLHEDKTQLRPSRVGLKFLGFKLAHSGRRLQQGALKRLNRRFRRWRWLRAKRELPAGTVARSLQVWQSWIAHANSTGVWRSIQRRLVQERIARGGNGSRSIGGESWREPPRKVRL